LQTHAYFGIIIPSTAGRVKCRTEKYIRRIDTTMKDEKLETVINEKIKALPREKKELVLIFIRALEKK
jgi:hypothetical protein